LRKVEACDRHFAVRIDAWADELEFGHVVVRHGADSAMVRDFPDTAELYARAIAAGGEVDDTVVAEALAFSAAPPSATPLPIVHHVGTTCASSRRRQSG
jgi:hypothetical protein